MKILITGINGMLGTELANILEQKHEILGIDIENTSSSRKVLKIDLTDHKSAYDAITKANPDLVIHTAAATNVDLCETGPAAAFKLNALATRNVALACQRFDAGMLYLSTDYVFSGQNKQSNGYNEFDTPDPISVYGLSKLAGENYVHDLLTKFYIIRTSWLFGHSRSNFVTQIADSIKSNKPVKTAADMISSPTYAKDLAKAISSVIGTNLYGTYHFTNSGFASRYDIGLFIAKTMLGNSNIIEKINISDLKLPAKRPNFSAMESLVWKLDGFDTIRPWQEAVREFLKDRGYLNA